MPDRTDVAIIGAGPYGLSIAAHLAALRVPFRIFGRPMENWQNMPRGMQLKSDGFASTLYDPQRVLTLGKYCRERGLGYADLGLPVSSAVFCEYGQAFQRRLVPDLDRRLVVRVVRNGAGFHLALEDGTTVQAKRVVVATGITNYAWLPPVLSGLPADKVTHSSAHAEPARFSGLDVVVVGGGSSAIDLSALMHEAGATEVSFVTTLVADLEKEHGFPPIKDVDVLRPSVGWNAVEVGLWKRDRMGLGLRHPEVTPWPDRIPPQERVGKSIYLWYFH